MFEPTKGDNNDDNSDSSDDSPSEEEELIDEEFKAANASRRTTLEWCKCGKCSLMEKNY